MLACAAMLVADCGQSAVNSAAEPTKQQSPPELEQAVVILQWRNGDDQAKSSEEERLQRKIRMGGWAVKSTDTKSGSTKSGTREVTDWVTTVVLERPIDRERTKREVSEEQERQLEVAKLQARFSQLKKGMKESEVVALLGQPTRKENPQGGDSVYSWYYGEGSSMYVMFGLEGDVWAWSKP